MLGCEQPVCCDGAAPQQPVNVEIRDLCGRLHPWAADPDETLIADHRRGARSEGRLQRGERSFRAARRSSPQQRLPCEQVPKPPTVLKPAVHHRAAT